MKENVVLTLEDELGFEEEIRVADRLTCLVGRSGDCAWRLHAPTVSRRHCLLYIDPPFVTVRDLGSRNGTFVNGERIEEEYDLIEGDVVQVGKARLTVHLEPAEVGLEMACE